MVVKALLAGKCLLKTKYTIENVLTMQMLFWKDNKKEDIQNLSVGIKEEVSKYFFCCFCVHQIKKVNCLVNKPTLLALLLSFSFKTKHSTPYIPSEWLVWGPIMAGTAILISQEHPIVQWVTFFRLLVIDRSLCSSQIIVIKINQQLSTFKLDLARIISK